MKLMIIAFGTMLILGFAFVGISSYAAADNLGPCNDGTSGVPDKESGATGKNYAKHHIVALAKIGGLGEGGHKPGSHQGFSLCNPSGK